MREDPTRMFSKLDPKRIPKLLHGFSTHPAGSLQATDEGGRERAG